VAVAYCGHDGVRAAQQHRPDVVLCDIGLPGLDGYAVARKLRGDPTTAKARLIAVTAYGRDEDRRRSHEAGFERHLVKPVEPDDLRRALDGPGLPGPNEWPGATPAGEPQNMSDRPGEEVARLVTGGASAGSSALAAGT
jgi:CheY-like chemotaxis protein